MLSKLLKDYFFAIAGAALFAILLRVFVIEAFRIPTDFMAPVLVPGDLIFVNKLDRVPHRGDVVVFSFPNDPTKDYIKRVIGIEGDSVEIRGGQVYLNGKPVSKPVDARSPDVFEEELDGHRYSVGWSGAARESRELIPVKVPPGQIFVLGDNRAKGQDSRGWGFLQSAAIKGKASLIWFSRGLLPDGKTLGVRWPRVMKRVD